MLLSVQDSKPDVAAINATLAKRKVTIYQLHHMLEGTISRNSLYAYLRGERGTEHSNVERIKAVLGILPKAKPAKRMKATTK